MKIGIRADGNSNIGMGHLQRCFSIANEFRVAEHECVFFVADKASQAIVENEQYRCVCLDSKWDDLETEIPEIKMYVTEQQIECLLIDTYFVTRKYLEAVQKCCTIAYIDDLFECIYPFDLLINYAIYSKALPYECYPDKTKLLLGTRYMPLREQFRDIEEKTIKKTPNNILITTGGTDHFNMAETLVDALLDKLSANCQINVICGRFNKQFEVLKAKQTEYQNLNVLHDVKDMVSVMREADIAISASGTTLYELAAVGTSFICFTLADNQMKNAQGFYDAGLAFYAGDVRNGISKLVDNIMKRLDLMWEDYDYRGAVSEKLRKIVDGYGAKRIAEELIILCRKDNI